MSYSIKNFNVTPPTIDEVELLPLMSNTLRLTRSEKAIYNPYGSTSKDDLLKGAVDPKIASH